MESELNELRALWRGDRPPGTIFAKYVKFGIFVILGFWSAWIVVQLPFGVIDIVMTPGRGGAVPIHEIHLVWRAILRFTIIACCVALPIGLWRSIYLAMKAMKAGIQPVLEATVCALAALAIFAAAGELSLILSWRIGLDLRDSYDPARTATNASFRLKRDAAFPFTGFWQTSCGNGVGVAIERESAFLQTYRLEDCGPSECGPHGGGSKVYSSIIGDPSFRVVEPDTIEFNANEDARYRVLYYRCG